MDHLAKLNPAQKQAVIEIEGPVLVIAGPGTGKTQVLTMRIAEILKRTQVNPGNILALTFTESGVVAMRERLREIVGPEGNYVDVYTFHAFCNDIIKKWPEKFVFAKELEPIMEVEKFQTMQSIIDNATLDFLKPFNSNYFYLKKSLDAISDLKREGIGVEDLKKLIAEDQQILDQEKEINPRTGKLKTKYVGRQRNIDRQRELALLYEKYQEKIREKGRYDFEDMIMFIVDKLKNDDFLLGYYQEKYQYFLIDEYQDTNSSQNAVITLLGSFFDNPNIFAVGDDDQAIYRFQGASLENILEFSSQYPEAKKIVLTENYRSDQKILDSARSLIVNNKDRLETRFPEITKELHAQKDGGEVFLAEFEDGNEEAYFIAKKITQLRDEGEPLDEIAVFYRNNADALDLVTFLEKLAVPYEISAGDNILADIQIQKIIAILTLINDPDDDVTFFRVLNFDFLGIEREDIYRLTKLTKKKRKHYYETIRDLSLLKESDLKNIIRINNLAVLLDQWIGYSANLTFADFFEHVLHESGFMDYILKRDDIRELNRLKRLFDMVKSLNRGNHSMQLKNFLDQLEVMNEYGLSIEETPLKSGQQSVQLMTAHKSKGLEFRNVFIFKTIEKRWEKPRGGNDIKLPEGIMRLQKAEKHEQEEDERRLFYVTVTRAKKNIFISYAKNYEIGKPKPEMPSRFINDLGDSVTKLDVSAYQVEAKERLQLIFAKTPEDLPESARLYLKDLIKDYVLSVTALNNYLTCPQKFLYQNLLGVPRVKPTYLAFGSAVHYGLQQFFDKFKQTKTLPALDCLLDEFKKGLEKEVLTKKEAEEALRKGEKILREYYEHGGFQIPYSTEYNFLSHKVFCDGVPLTGKIDKIEPVDEQLGTVNVVDYKTGRVKTENEIRGITENSEGDLMRQIVFYKILGDCDPWFKWKIVSGELDFVEKPNKKVRIKILPADVEGLTREIKSAYSSMQDLKFDKIEKGKPCERCEFKKICWRS